MISKIKNILEKAAYLDKYHGEILESSQMIWAYHQNLNYQIKESIYDLEISENLALIHKRSITLTGSSFPEKNPIRMIRTVIKGEPSVDYKDLDFIVKSDEGKNMPYYPCIDLRQEKRIIIFFIPEIENDKDVRKYTVNYKWPKFWTKLFKTGEDSIRIVPRSEGTIEKFLIRLTMDRKIEKKFPDIKCANLPLEGNLTNFVEENGNKSYEWAINNAKSNVEYTLKIKHKR